MWPWAEPAENMRRPLPRHLPSEAHQAGADGETRWTRGGGSALGSQASGSTIFLSPTYPLSALALAQAGALRHLS